MMKLLKRITLGAALSLVAYSALAQDPPAAEPAGAKAPADAPVPAPAEPREPDRATLEKQFAKTMTGATLVGHFTVGNRGGGQPKEDRYTIQRVTKQAGDKWLFLARMQFGGRDVTVPMIIPVKWAGDTAVISVTDVGVPGVGTYTARVLIYDDQYAGTWSGKDHGGHMWGRIERAGADDANSGDSNAPRPQDGEEKKPQ